MGNIVLLDDLTINKIAAGEVIERPASVIKEMLENSIDAGATNITIEIKNGGISYIRITDNGKGIPEDDMEMAFERHATSKIRSAEDLSTVTSMGFRGEALASIAAIAKVEMISKTADQENGYKVVVEGGNVLEKSEAGSPVGTSITVTNLFYNTPVRYKFLKKDYTEAGYIEDIVTRIALVHPEIAIKLINTGKTIIQTNGNNDLKTVIYSIYGKDVAGGLIETDYTYEGIHIYGVIGKPEIARSNRANQIFFVNKRYIRDKALSSAAERAYKGMIPIGKFAFLVLNLDMNPTKVDVNVHPAKLEVRFEEENVVFKAVYHAIKEALLKAELVADTDHTSSKKREQSGLFGNKSNNQETIVEQIYKARQAQGIPTIERKLPWQEAKIPETQNTNNISINNNSNIPEIERSQEVLRKLQEIKEKLIQESPELKAKIEEENRLKLEENLKTEQTQELEKIEEPTNEIHYEQSEEEEKNGVEEDEIPYAVREMQKEKEKEEKIKEEVQEPKVDLLEEIAKANQRPINLKEEVEKALEKPTNETEHIEQEPQKSKITESSEYSKEFEEMYLKLFGTKPVRGQNIEETEKKEENAAEDIAKYENVSVFDNIEEYKKPTYKFIGIVFNTYIIIEIEK